uniref:Uncharacterized protein n=1 Tax=Tanacetum cinerariifolium TaxID=118510 RepID=A0A699J0W9_TANCI|nr:hypothetical protein [Tanacetum cinerariifolium]
MEALRVCQANKHDKEREVSLYYTKLNYEKEDDVTLHFLDVQALVPRILTGERGMRNSGRLCDREKIPGAITTEKHPQKRMSAKGEEISWEQSAIYRQSMEPFCLAGLFSSKAGPLITKGAALTFKEAAQGQTLPFFVFSRGGTLGGGYIVKVKYPLVDGDVEDVDDLSLELIEDEKVATMDGVFEGAFREIGLEVEALVDAMEVMVVDY